MATAIVVPAAAWNEWGMGFDNYYVWMVLVGGGQYLAGKLTPGWSGLSLATWSWMTFALGTAINLVLYAVVVRVVFATGQTR